MVLNAHPKKSTLILVRYVNNFVVLHTIQVGHRIGSDILGGMVKVHGTEIALDKGGHRMGTNILGGMVKVHGTEIAPR